ncbi:DUF1127 domain-containing protein [Salipiger sp. IMCC34102]|uniref:DUF1127 domain-containing protein n=1 Tax=Salipiger sp. IMCC34102 TaxID=2510647 RepID=UPI00101C64A2|nr:DUF1127 domain-containing protein [Salipiger sp. IMCC34102]RYH02673.1 DUF1127 domain-containing protein [Salipiger sp. IMCC34102]
MALFSTNTAPNGLAGLRARLIDAANRRRVYSATVRELSALSNRELDDLGISRSMVKSIAAEAAYGN